MEDKFPALKHWWNIWNHLSSIHSEISKSPFFYGWDVKCLLTCFLLPQAKCCVKLEDILPPTFFHSFRSFRQFSHAEGLATKKWSLYVIVLWFCFQRIVSFVYRYWLLLAPSCTHFWVRHPSGETWREFPHRRSHPVPVRGTIHSFTAQCFDNVFCSSKRRELGENRSFWRICLWIF